MLHWLDFKNIFIWPGFSHFFAMLSFLNLFFAYETEFFWKRMHQPRGIWIPHYACAHWSFQNSGRCRCTPRGIWSLKFGPHRDLPTEEKKIEQRKSRMTKQGIGFEVKLQRGITLDIPNEIMRFKRKFVLLSTSKKIGGGVLIYRYDIILNFYLDS